jgi:hypothetical protein
LHAGGNAENEGLAHEHDESAQADGRQGWVAKKSYHRRIDDIQEVLRYHSANDRQGKGENSLPAIRVYTQVNFFSFFLASNSA